MRRVIMVTHSRFHDPRTKIHFHETVVKNPDPDAPEHSYLNMAVAEDVPEDVVNKYYRGNKRYLLDGYPEPVVEDEDEDTEPTEAPVTDTGKEPDQVDGDGTDAQTDTEPATQEDKPGDLAGVDFASDDAAELAATFGHVASQYKGVIPSGVSGYTVKDVRLVNKRG